MLMMTALDERSASERDVRQRETEGKSIIVNIVADVTEVKIYITKGDMQL